MSYNTFTPIVSSGLTLYLDAANTKSYSGSGTSWLDLSTYGNTGTLTNGPTFSGGNSGTIIFDGTNDQVLVTNSSTFNNTSSKSVEMWVNTGSIGANFVVILTNRGVDDFNVNFTFLIDNRNLVRPWNPAGTNSMVLVYSMGTNSAGYYAYSNNKLGTTNGDNSWHHIVGVTDLSQNKLFLYYDGELVNSTNTSGTPAVPSANLRIGSGYTSGGSDFPFTGRISITKIYNRVLTQSEILQNYNATKFRFQ